MQRITANSNYHYPLLLIFIGVLVFYNVVFKGFILDDKIQILANPTVQTLNSIPSFFVSTLHYTPNPSVFTGFTYRPITFSVYTALYAVGNGNALPFHLFLLILYLINVVLVYFLFSQFLKPGLAFLMALIFLVHPVNQEIVAYIADIQDALYFFFGISALLILLKEKIRLREITLSCFLLVTAGISKETGFIFIPGALIIIFLFKRRLFLKFSILLSFTFLCYILLRLHAGQTPFLTITVPESSTIQLQPLTQLLLIPKMLSYYVWVIFMPLPSLPIQFLMNTNTLISIASLLFVVVFYSGVSLLIPPIREKAVRMYKGYVFFFLLFLISTLFHSQILPLDVIVSKRWVYLQLFAVLGMIGIVIQAWYPHLKRYKHLLLVFYLVYFLILLIETVIALSYY